jgi:hypothetical protein
MSDEDLAELDARITAEYEFIPQLGDDIMAATADGLTDKDFSASFRMRAEMWANRYSDMVTQAQLWFGGKDKFEWQLGATEQHCSTCSQLDGIVAYASEWDESGLHPQGAPNDNLECGGWQCDCSLNATDKRRTNDALGRLMDIAVGSHV